MSLSRKVGRKAANIDLVLVLLVVAALELTLNRLAVPVLRPPGSAVPPWHRDLDVVGLFVFHLATALAFLVGGWKVVELAARPVRFGLPARVLLICAAALFYGLAANLNWTPRLDGFMLVKEMSYS